MQNSSLFFSADSLVCLFSYKLIKHSEMKNCNLSSSSSSFRVGEGKAAKVKVRLIL
jgi:hypothetical protein